MKSSPRNRNSSGEISIFLQWGWEVHWFQSVICLLSVDTVLSSAELICLEVKWFNILYVYALVECKNESLWAWPFSRCSNNWFLSSPNLINWEEQLQLSEQMNCVYLWALSHILCGPLICVSSVRGYSLMCPFQNYWIKLFLLWKNVWPFSL
jgi:hypothetical protein